MHDVRLTLAVLHVLRQFVEDVSQPRYGYELMQATGYPSGKLYPILARLAGAGWLIRKPESVDPSEAGRPIRYTYTLTAGGAARARQLLATHSEQLSPPSGSRSINVPHGSKT
jgi:PadR family transcriptional regulator, regulatory protein PadR